MDLFLFSITIACCYSLAESSYMCEAEGKPCRGNGRGGHDNCCLMSYKNKKLECRTPDGGYGRPLSGRTHNDDNGYCLSADTVFPWVPPVTEPHCGKRDRSCSTRNGEVAGCCAGLECIGKPYDQHCFIPGCKYYLESCEKDEDCCRSMDQCHPIKKQCGAQSTDFEGCRKFKESCTKNEDCCEPERRRCTGPPSDRLCY